MRLAAVPVAIVTFAFTVACRPSDDAPERAGLPTAPPSPTSSAAAAEATVTTPASTPETVFKTFVAAVNEGRIASAKDLFAADAIWERGGQCPPAQCVGSARLGQEIERDVANHHRLDITSIAVAGEVVTARIELQTDGTRSAGVGRMIQLFTVRVRGGKIVELRALNDLSDPETAAFASQRSRQ